MIRYAAGHDPADFVLYIGDRSYLKLLLSPAELDRLVAAAVAHMRANGRDVQLIERLPEPTEYHG